MTPEREKYFMDGMNRLADQFELWASRFPAVFSVIPEADLLDLTAEEMDEKVALVDPHMPRLRQDYMQASRALFEEYEAEPPSKPDWNTLIIRSGAHQRLEKALERSDISF